jgi:hypothetical protein
MPRHACVPNIRDRRLALIPALAALAIAATPAHPASAEPRSAVTSGQAPTASFTALVGVIHNKCGFFALFRADASTAPAGESITRYAWSFGDGSAVTTTNPEILHGYHAGRYVVVLTVTDTDGATARASRAISGGSGSLYCA